MTGWTRSMLPADRDGRFNDLADGACVLYRELGPGDRIEAMSVTVRGEDGQTMLYGLVRGESDVRRLVVTDRAAVADALAEAIRAGTVDASGEGAALWSVKLGFGVIAQPVPVCLPVAAGLLGGLAEVLADVLKAVALGYLPHHGPAEARAGPEAHQQDILLGLLVFALGFEQVRHLPGHSFIMPRHVLTS